MEMNAQVNTFSDEWVYTKTSSCFDRGQQRQNKEMAFRQHPMQISPLRAG